MQAPLQIRSFTETDRVALQELFLLARRAAFPWIDPATFHLVDFDEATAGEVIYVAEILGQIVGFGSVWKTDNFLHNLFVHPQYLRQGIGLALLRACVRDIGRPVRLKCLIQNTSAIEFYTAMGWMIAERGSDPLGEYFVMTLAR